MPVAEWNCISPPKTSSSQIVAGLTTDESLKKFTTSSGRLEIPLLGSPLKKHANARMDTNSRFERN
jgi:hypothetical protein